MAESALSRTIADTVTLSRELREEGQIDGQVKLYNVDDNAEFESDADLFFERTLMTNGLREALTILRDALTGDDPRGIHILYGPYGSGKSHQMVALYHCFAESTAASEWAGDEIEGFADALPTSGTPITVAMQNEQYEYLWEPFFDSLNYDPGSYDTGGYPDMQTIREAVGDRTVVFLVDELEDWFDTLTGDRRSANRGFLQALLEATALSDLELYTIVSVLREGSEVHDILEREQAVEVNMNNQVDKRKVLRHRLFETIDEPAAREIVDGYVDAYEQSDHVDVPSDLRSRMVADYPFHPVLIDALETRYYADEAHQNTRGMIYLFSELLRAFHPDVVWRERDDDADVFARDETDLITHGDVDTIAFEDELSRVNYKRQDVCAGDIENRINDEEVPHGRRILNTILLYSMKPSEGEGSEISEIVMGVHRTGDLVSDIVLNLERLHGVAWHLHKLNGKYAIRDRQNPNALIRNAAVDVSEESAKAEIGDIIEDLFGSGTHTVGFHTDDIAKVPDTRDIKVVVKDSEWSQEEIEEVVTDRGRGREWRNTLVFVQPSGEAIESGTRYVDKACYIEGARQVLAGDSLDEEICASIEDMKSQEERELRDELELAYGEAFDGDDPLNDYDPYAWMELDIFVEEGNDLRAGDIAVAAADDPFDLEQSIWPIVDDLLDRRGSVSIEDVYEELLRQPAHPVPGSRNDVLNATVEVLRDKPVLAHDESGFREDLAGSSIGTVLVREDAVERWTVDDVEQELRQRFGSGETAIDIGDFELQLLESTDVWLSGEDGHDVVMMAIGRLNQEDAYIIVRGNEILDRPQSDATLRDVSGAEVIGATYLEERIREALDAEGAAHIERIIGSIRGDESVFLPPKETENAAREAVNDLLVGNHVLKVDGRYHDALGDRDATAVTVVPTVSERIGEKIVEYAGGLEPGDQFTVGSVANQYDASVTEDAVKTFLLIHLGREEEPAYVVGPSGSEDAGDWMPGYPFRVPDAEGWRFEFTGDDVEALRRKWREEHGTGDVSYGDVTFTLPDSEGVPNPLQGKADVVKTNVSLTLEAGQDYTNVQDLFEPIPDETESLKVEISFE